MYHKKLTILSFFMNKIFFLKIVHTFGNGPPGLKGGGPNAGGLAPGILPFGGPKSGGAPCPLIGGGIIPGLNTIPPGGLGGMPGLGGGLLVNRPSMLGGKPAPLFNLDGELSVILVSFVLFFSVLNQ